MAIGTSIMTFLVRAVGTTLGCIWGWAAYEAGNGNEIVAAAMICIGVFPAAYVQLGSKYPKAGIVAIVSMSVVALATELKTVPGRRSNISFEACFIDRIRHCNGKLFETAHCIHYRRCGSPHRPGRPLTSEGENQAYRLTGCLS